MNCLIDHEPEHGKSNHGMCQHDDLDGRFYPSSLIGEGDDQKGNERAYLLMIDAISLDCRPVVGVAITTGEGWEDEDADEVVDESSLDIRSISPASRNIGA